MTNNQRAIEKLMSEEDDPTLDQMSSEELDLWFNTLKEDRESLIKMQRDLCEQIKALDKDIREINLERIRRSKWPKGPLRISTDMFGSF